MKQTSQGISVSRCAMPRALLVVLALSGCAHQPPAPTVVDRLEEIEARVEAVDATKRVVTLRTADGTGITTRVGDEVRNLQQVRVGDRVVVRYYEAIAAQFAGADKGALAQGETELLALRAAPGDRPAAALATSSTSTVIVDSVDRTRNTVSFTGEDGIMRRLHVVDADAQRFIKALRKGDRVSVTYVEAYAVSVEPV